MTGGNENNRFNYVHLLPSFIIALLTAAALFFMGINSDIHNFDKVLDGAINFSSIVLGFLGALLGILLSIKDSEIVKAIFRNNGKSLLKYYFNESFITGLLVVILSSIMHIVRKDKGDPTLLADIMFYVWVTIVVFFIFSTYRIVNILMNVFFKANDNNAQTRPEGNTITDEERRNEMRNRLSR